MYDDKKHFKALSANLQFESAIKKMGADTQK